MGDTQTNGFSLSFHWFSVSFPWVSSQLAHHISIILGSAHLDDTVEAGHRDEPTVDSNEGHIS